MTKSYVLVLTSLFLAVSLSIGQTEKERQHLNDLDSLAFSALENGESNVEGKAKVLLEASQKYGSSMHEINAYTLLGIANKNKGYYVTSVEFYQKALIVAEKNSDLGRASACFNNIGTVYQIQENFPKALEYFKKSLYMEEQLDNPLQKSIRLYNIGDMYREMDSLSLALSNFNSSLLIEQEHRNDVGILYALLGISDIYLKLDKPADASISLTEAKSYLSDGDIETQVVYHILRSDFLLGENNFDGALSELSTAKEISKSNNFKVHLSDIYEKEISLKEAQESFDKNTEKAESATSSNINIWWWIIPITLLCALLLLILRKRRPNQVHESDSVPKESERSFKLISDAGKVLLEISFNSIICFEANDNYVVTYYLADGAIQKSMERASLKKIETIVGDETSFFRVHKSFIINKTHLQKIEGKSQAYKIRMHQMETLIPVSRSFEIESIIK